MTTFDGARILIVDDDRFMRAMIRELVRSASRFEVSEAEDGDIAIVEVDRLRPDVVLCDVSMARMGGLQFVEMLRTHPDVQLRDTPIVLLTGHAEEATVIAASRLKIDGYVIKPVSMNQVSETLRKVPGAR